MLYDRFAALLEYPTSPPAGICAALLSEGLRRFPRAAVQLAAFAAGVDHVPLLEMQEVYTRIFDFDSDTALYIGHHVFGEEGRRGLFIAGLVDRYGRVGIEHGVELADHFSPVLRSLARDSTSDEAHDLIRLALRPAIARVLPALERRAAAYAALLHALALVIDEQTGEPFELRSDRCQSSSSPYFLTLLS